MGKGIVYIATTLDGYIAGKKGSLDRLNNFPNPDELDYEYSNLLSDIDTLLMGRNTYKAILDMDDKWPYDHYATYVMSRDPDLEITTPDTHMINGLSPETMKKLHDKSQKNIRIVGGGSVITQCLDIGAVDEIIISILPIVLGKGTRLFPNPTKQLNFTLIKSQSFETGIVMLHYKKKDSVEE